MVDEFLPYPPAQVWVALTDPEVRRYVVGRHA